MTQWSDSSGAFNDVTAGGDPQLVVSGTPSGQPAISLDGAGDKLERVHTTDPLNGFPIGDAERTLFLVGRYAAAGKWAGAAYGNGAPNEAFGVVARSGNGRLALQGWGSGNDRVSGTAGVGAGWLVQSAVLEAGTATLYKDGVPITSWSHVYNTVLSKVAIGAEIADLGFVTMDVAAVLVYNRALDATDRAAVDAYLQNKYLAP